MAGLPQISKLSQDDSPSDDDDPDPDADDTHITAIG